MKLKSLLREESIGEYQANAKFYRPTEISDRVFSSWCRNNAQKVLKNYKPIYRGFDAPAVGIIDTNGMNRKSANTKNYYTLWMDNYVAWKNYPKRSKSLICATSSIISEDFGEVQLIIPADKNKIGICSDYDLWFSFEELSKAYGHNGNLEHLMDDISKIFYTLYSASIAKSAGDNFHVLEKCLKDATLTKMKEEVEIEDTTPEKFKSESKSAIGICENKGYDSLYELFGALLVPEGNGFNETTGAVWGTANFPKREVWVQGECVTVDLYKCHDLWNRLARANLNDDHFFDFLIKVGQ